MTTVPDGSYRKIKLDENVVSDKLTTDTLTASTSKDKNKGIDGVCEFQMNATNFGTLKTKLQESLTQKLTTYGTHETEGLESGRKVITQELERAKKELNDSKSVFESLTKSFELVADVAELTSEGSLTRTSQDKLITAEKQIKEQLKKAKEVLDKLNGSLVSGGVFAKTDAAVESLKKNAVKTDSFINDIDLAADNIEGYLYTSGWRVSDRNLAGKKGKILKVNAKKKEYLIDYSESGSKDKKTITVKQKDLCLVSDDKNPPKSK